MRCRVVADLAHRSCTVADCCHKSYSTPSQSQSYFRYPGNHHTGRGDTRQSPHQSSIAGSPRNKGPHPWPACTPLNVKGKKKKSASCRNAMKDYSSQCILKLEQQTVSTCTLFPTIHPVVPWLSTELLTLFLALEVVSVALATTILELHTPFLLRIIVPAWLEGLARTLILGLLTDLSNCAGWNNLCESYYPKYQSLKQEKPGSLAKEICQQWLPSCVLESMPLCLEGTRFQQERDTLNVLGVFILLERLS